MSLNKEEAEVILLLVDMSLKYGVPLVQKYLEKMNKKVITKGDIDNLKIDKDWEDYFD